MTAAAQTSTGSTNAGLTVGDVTRTQLYTLPESAGQMLADNQRRLLVSDADGNLEGLVTQRDLLRSTLLNLYVSYRK